MATPCLALCVVLGCSDTAQPAASAGSAQRIVTLVPAATEVLLALGAADRIVARTDYDAQPDIAHVASVGRNMRVSAEGILAYTPDLVIDASYAQWSAPQDVLERTRVQTLTTDLQTFDDILSLIDTLGVLVDARQRAAAVRRDMLASAARLRRTAPGPQPHALYLVWPDPPRTIASTSYLNDVLELAGMRNAFPELRAAWSELSMEVILHRDPDYIVVATESTGALERFRTDHAWRELTAVKAGRVIEVPVALFHRPGPRVVEAAYWLRRAVQRTQAER